MEEQVFKYLSERMNSHIPFNAYARQNSGNAGEAYSNTIISLCAKGLIRLIPGGTGQGEIIVKTDEFYKADALGFSAWNFGYNKRLENDREIARWNRTFYKYRSVAAKYWWLSIPISLIALVISVLK